MLGGRWRWGGALRGEGQQGNSNSHLLLIVASTKSQKTGIRLQCGLEEPMASVMAIGSEVFGSCVGEIDVSVEQKDVVVWLCYGWNSMRLFRGRKAAQDWWWRWEMVPGIGRRLGQCELD